MFALFQSCHQRLSAWVCLMVVLTSFSWVRAVAVYAIARADASHTAEVFVHQGGLAVVLRHEAAASEAASPCAGHRHGVTARLITLFASAASAREDHVVRVGGGPDPLTPASQPPTVREAPAPVAEAPMSPMGIRLALDRAGPARVPRPPPVPDARLTALRVTVLLV